MVFCFAHLHLLNSISNIFELWQNYEQKIEEIINSKDVLTRMSLKGPLNLTTEIPTRCFTWDDKTWTAAPVVKPDTNISDKKTQREPSCKIPRTIWKKKEER